MFGSLCSMAVSYYSLSLLKFTYLININVEKMETNILDGSFNCANLQIPSTAVVCLYRVYRNMKIQAYLG